MHAKTTTNKRPNMALHPRPQTAEETTGSALHFLNNNPEREQYQSSEKNL